MMLDWASGRWVTGLFAESLVVFVWYVLKLLFWVCELFVLGILLRCKHYKRRCKIRAPCCNEIFCCRHCHNESTVPESLSVRVLSICLVRVLRICRLCFGEILVFGFRRIDMKSAASMFKRWVLIPCLFCFLREGLERLRFISMIWFCR